MTVITSSEASSDLPQFLARAATGEEFLIVEDGKEVARIVPPERAKHASVQIESTFDGSDDMERPWRGVFAPPRERRPMKHFVLGVDGPPLKHREPSPNFNFSRAEPDHA